VIVGLRFLIVVLSVYKQIRAQSEDVLCDVGEDNFNRAFDFLRPGIDHIHRPPFPQHSSHIFALVIHGNADLGPRISEGEVQSTLDFCVALFKPVNQGVANKLRKHLEGVDRDPFLAYGPEETGAKDGQVASGQTERDDVVAAPSSGGDPEPVTRSPPTTPAIPGKFPFENAAALLNPNAPLLSVTEIKNIAKNPSLLPALENGSVMEAEAEVQRILEKVNARRVIHQEHSDLHSLEEESLGAGYRLRLECGRLGLVQGKVVD
jgi:hypothetical protein